MKTSINYYPIFFREITILKKVKKWANIIREEKERNQRGKAKNEQNNADISSSFCIV